MSQDSSSDFDEIILDATPAAGTLHYHGLKPISRRPRTKKYCRRFCRCACSKFYVYEDSEWRGKEPEFIINLIASQTTVIPSPDQYTMFQIHVENGKMVHHFALPDRHLKDKRTQPHRGFHTKLSKVFGAVSNDSEKKRTINNNVYDSTISDSAHNINLQADLSAEDIDSRNVIINSDQDHKQSSLNIDGIREIRKSFYIQTCLYVLNLKLTHTHIIANFRDMRPQTVADWLNTIAQHTTTASYHGNNSVKYPLDDMNGLTGIDLPSIRDMSIGETACIALDGLNLVESDRERLSNHHETPETEVNSTKDNRRTSSAICISPVNVNLSKKSQVLQDRMRSLGKASISCNQQYNYQNQEEESFESPRLVNTPIISKNLAGLKGKISDEDGKALSAIKHVSNHGTPDQDQTRQIKVTDNKRQSLLRHNNGERTPSGRTSGDLMRNVTTECDVNNLNSRNTTDDSAARSISSMKQNDVTDDIEDCDESLALRRRRMRRGSASRMKKVTVVMSGVVDKLGSVAPIFQARTVILYPDRITFTRGIGTLNGPKEVYLVDVMRVLHPDPVKKPTVFHIEARKRTKKGKPKKGTIKHVFRCPNSDDWVDRIDTLIHAIRAPKIN